MIFFDTETCGLHGPIVLIQYAEDDGEIKLHDVWYSTVRETIELLESFASHSGGVCGFNLAFDWFHVCQMHATLSLLVDKDAELIDCIEEYAEAEPLGRDGACVKPVSACDIMLHARRGPYQSTMDRDDVRIRRVPTVLAWKLAHELEQRVKLKDIYFAKRKNKNQPKWQIYDVKNEDGENDPDFKDVVLKFAPSSALKALSVDALNLKVDSVLLFADVDISDKMLPEELGYAPFAKAIGDRSNWRGAWPQVIKHHAEHWRYHKLARQYGADDVRYTRDLWKFFGSPKPGDDDSELACMVGAVRWRGYKVDVQGMLELKEKALAKKRRTDGFKIPTDPTKARIYVTEHMDATEKLVVNNSTKRVLLEEISKWTRECDCTPEADCPKCSNTRLVKHTSAERAADVLAARQGSYEANFYDKLLKAGRFHVSLSVIGALSSRMSGSGSSKGIEQSGLAGGDDLNAQGVKKTKEVRAKFPLAWTDTYVLPDGRLQPGMKLCGGDFDGFEVTIAVAVYKDARLEFMLLTCERCEGRMKFVQRARMDEFLTADGRASFLDWAPKAEVQKYEDSLKELEKARAECRVDLPKVYKPKTIEQLESKVFENDFICTACGSNKGKKIHALFGVHVFPEEDYESLKATSGTSDDKYTRSKSGLFAIMYGGTEHTLANRLGVPVEVGLEALASFHREFPGVRRFQMDIYNSFCSMRQPGGIGSKVEWHEPADYRETMFGFRRHFTLENKVSKVLFELANNPPKDWHKIKVKVERREGRMQTAGGAVQSALYGAAFQLQAANMRAACNHDIQSAGATATKMVQRRIWDIQPAGANPWLVQPFNIHDEIESPCVEEVAERVKSVVQSVVEELREKIPLIKMDWGTGLNTWADKG